MNMHTLARLRRYLQVKHHIPGRIRVVYDQRLAAAPEVRELVRNHGELPPGVRGVRLNLLAMSVVIEYDPARIQPGLLEELATTACDDRAARIVQELDEALRTGATPDSARPIQGGSAMQTDPPQTGNKEDHA